MKSLSIILNGPSLSKTKHKLDLDQDKLVCNHFADQNEFSELKPNFYLLQDEYFWSNSVSSFYKKKREKTYNALLSTQHSFTLILPNASAYSMLTHNYPEMKKINSLYIPYKYRVFGYDVYSILSYQSKLAKLARTYR